MTGFNGYQSKALYWRDDRAEYGRQTAYPLTLEPGNYKFTFAMAAWKGTPKYKAQLLGSDGNAVVESEMLSATPNANGNTSASVKSAKSQELEFEVTKKGKFYISFTDATTTSGMHEFLLLECRINEVITTGIAQYPSPNTQHPSPNTQTPSPVTIYSPSGSVLKTLRPGLNIVTGADGKTRKVIVK